MAELDYQNWGAWDWRNAAPSPESMGYVKGTDEFGQPTWGVMRQNWGGGETGMTTYFQPMPIPELTKQVGDYTITFDPMSQYATRVTGNGVDTRGENARYIGAGLIDPRLQNAVSGYQNTSGVIDDYLANLYQKNPLEAAQVLGQINDRGTKPGGRADWTAFKPEMYWGSIFGDPTARSFWQGNMSAEAQAAAASPGGFFNLSEMGPYLAMLAPAAAEIISGAGGALFGGGAGYDAGATMDAAIANGANSVGFQPNYNLGGDGFGLDMIGNSTAALTPNQINALQPPSFNFGSSGIDNLVNQSVNTGGNYIDPSLRMPTNVGASGATASGGSNMDFWDILSQNVPVGSSGNYLDNIVNQAVSSGGNYIDPWSAGSITGVNGLSGITPEQLASISASTGMDLTGLQTAIAGGATSPAFLQNILDLATKFGTTPANMLKILGGGVATSAAGGNVGQSTGLLSGIGDMFSNLTNKLTENITAGQVAQTAAYTAAAQAQAQAAKEAAQTQANAQLEAAKIAAEAARFKPVGVTTRFGSSNFGFDDKGNLTSAGYTLTPEMKAQQDALMSASNDALKQYQAAVGATAPMGAAAQQMMGIGSQGLTTGQGLLTDAALLRPDIAALLKQTAPIGAAGQQALGLGTSNMGLSQSIIDQAAALRPNIAALQAQTAPLGAAGQTAMTLGQKYLSTDPAAQAAKYMAEQQALLAASRERDLSGLQNKLAQQGRLGLATGGTSTGMMAANPEMEAYYNAIRQQDLGLAAQATQGGMDYTKFGAGMVGTGGDLINKMYGTQTAAFDPYKSMLNIGTNLGQYGAGMAKSGTDLMQGMYGVQTAAYDPYKTASQLGMDYTKYGAGMVGTGGDLLSKMYGTQTAAYTPYETALGGVKGIEALGQNALQTGMDLGRTATNASANAGQYLSQGMTNAANTTAATNAYSPWANLLGGVGGMFSNTQSQQYKFDPFTGKAL